MTAIFRALWCISLLALAPLTGCTQPTGKHDGFYWNKFLGKGVNLGNVLEAPRDASWGIKISDEDFKHIKKAGFNSVRIPMRWSDYASHEAPYTIEPEFFKTADWAVNQALSNDLVAVINIHHYHELFAHPEANKARLLGMWQQIAEHYKNYPGQLYFEILNEPNNNLTEALWNQYLVEALAVIRASNPKRAVVIGPGHWNNITALEHLKLPEQDRNLIVTVHYYNPFNFTHQGAQWLDDQPSDTWVGLTWSATAEQMAAMQADFKLVKDWATAHNRPIYVGEFGAYSKADLASRAQWTKAVAQLAEANGFSMAYWEYGAGFGLFDQAKKQWRAPLLKALAL